MDDETSKQFSSVDARFAAVDGRLHALEIDVAVIRSNYATKADVLAVREDIAKLKAAMLKWMMGTALGIAMVAASATLALARLLG